MTYMHKLECFDKDVNTILFLYLLHHGPKTSYVISKRFSEAIDNKKWNVEKTKDLSRSNKVSGFLKNMMDNGLLIIKEEKDLKNNRDQIWYDINPSVLLSDESFLSHNEKDYKDTCTILDAVRYPDNSDAQKRMDEIVTSGSVPLQIEQHMAQSDHYINNNKYISEIKEYSKNEIDSIQKINSLNKFDYITVLVYCRELLQYMATFTAAWSEGKKIEKEIGWRNIDNVFKCIRGGKVTTNKTTYQVPDEIIKMIDIGEKNNIPLDILKILGHCGHKSNIDNTITLINQKIYTHLREERGFSYSLDF